MNTADTQGTIGKSSLDYFRFDALSKEALQLIRRRKQCSKKERKEIKSQVADLKETTKKAAVTRRSSTSQQ